MRPVTFSFPTITQNEICATNTTAASGASLTINGSLSNIAQLNGGLPYTPLANAGPGIQRSVTVYSTGNISTSTFTVTGYDVNGYSYSTTLSGPTGTAIPTHTTQEFQVVTAVSVGNTLASSPFTVGFGASGSTNAVVVDLFANPVNLTLALVKGASSGPVTFQHAFDSPFTATAPTWSTVTFSSGVSLASVTTATSITIADAPAQARAILVATAAATGTIQVVIIQPGR